MVFQQRLTLWAALLLFVASVLSAAGQSSITSVRGTVTDPSGALVPGAKIELKNIANGQIVSLTANEQGEYHFSQVEPGTYRFRPRAAASVQKTRRRSCW